MMIVEYVCIYVAVCISSLRGGLHHIRNDQHLFFIINLQTHAADSLGCLWTHLWNVADSDYGLYLK